MLCAEWQAPSRTHTHSLTQQGPENSTQLLRAGRWSMKLLQHLHVVPKTPQRVRQLQL